MAKSKKPRRTGAQQPRRGTARPIDVTVGNKATRAFLATIENDGVDAEGKVVGTNGIRWAV